MRKSSPVTTAFSASTPTTAIDGAGISVAVYNGTTVTGLAAKAADTLRNDNFTVTGTAVASAQDHATTLIEYGAGHLQGAQELARAFPGAKLEQTVEAPRGSEASFASEADIVRKFKTLAMHTFSAAKADAAVNLVLGADKLARAEEISAALANG